AAMRSLGENAKQVMVSHPITISQDANLIDAADMMLKHRANHICVVDDDKLTGIISKRDVINEAYKNK
ncbi:MAG: CBS domain-containing protein, partial [Methanosarcinales archaeon]|nr:CBS domain-containing protein [Methanosarcinales archaeon]